MDCVITGRQREAARIEGTINDIELGNSLLLADCSIVSLSGKVSAVLDLRWDQKTGRTLGEWQRGCP
jgi:hypothetical protein